MAETADPLTILEARVSISTAISGAEVEVTHIQASPVAKEVQKPTGSAVQPRTTTTDKEDLAPGPATTDSEGQDIDSGDVDRTSFGDPDYKPTEEEAKKLRRLEKRMAGQKADKKKKKRSGTDSSPATRKGKSKAAPKKGKGHGTKTSGGPLHAPSKRQRLDDEAEESPDEESYIMGGVDIREPLPQMQHDPEGGMTSAQVDRFNLHSAQLGYIAGM